MVDTIEILAPVEQEGTKAIVKSWYIQLGEEIAEGDPLVELETDKVAVEVPAPQSGVLLEIVIDADGEAEPGALLGKLQCGAVERKEAIAATSLENGSDQSDVTEEFQPTPSLETEDRLSPAVRRLISEHGLNSALISGTGKNRRLTKSDVLSFIATSSPSLPSKKGSAHLRESGTADNKRVTRIPHDSMRRRIADHMQHSVQTAPHVTAVFEADFSSIIAHRRANKSDFAAKGVNLTFTAYFVAACAEAMRAAPAVNSQWNDDYLDVFDDINIGVGVALGDKGLIVPVIKEAQNKSLFDIAKDLQRLTEKARSGGLAPADVRGGTFSISNHGTSGSLVATPIIINQPQSAILGIGKLEKRVVVRDVDGVESLQVLPMAYVSLTIDHRVLDGAQTNAWLSSFVSTIENWRSN